MKSGRVDALRAIGVICLALIVALSISVAASAQPVAGHGASLDSKCTMCVAGKNGTADGSILVWHNEELGRHCAERLTVVPRKYHAPGEMKNVGWESIPEAPVTYKVIVNKYWPGGYPPGDWAAGINEFGVNLVANAQMSKETPLPTGEGVSYCYLVQVVLERARTAREAVGILGRLVDEYGVGGPWAECSYVLADQNEAWYIELSYTHWVAHRVRDDELLPISNRYVIGEDFDLSSADVIDYAVAHGWYDPASGKPFSWKDAYGVPTNQEKVLYINRTARIAALLAPKWGSITPRDCFEAMRDHNDGTDLYFYPPHQAPSAQRPICSDSSCMAFVFQMRPDLPPDIGALMWYRMAAACSSVHIPIWAGVTELPDVYTMLLSDQYDPVSAWWHFRSLMENVDVDYANLNPHVRGAWYQFEQRELTQAPQVEGHALKAYQSGNAAKMDKELTTYTNKTLVEAYNKANALNKWVLSQ